MEDTSKYFDNWGADNYADDFYPSMFEDFNYDQAMKGQEQLLSQISKEKEQLEGAVKPLRIHYDDSGYYVYVLLDGDVGAVNETIRILNERNILSIHKGRNYRPANDGNQYHWFIRVIEVSDNQYKKPAKETIDDIFISVWGVVGEKKSELTNNIQQLQANLLIVENEKQILENNLEIVNKELDHVKKSHESLNVEYSKLKKEVENQGDSLRKENKEIEEVTDAWKTAEDQIEQLKREKKQLEEKILKISKDKEKIEIQFNSYKKSPSNYESDFKKVLSCFLENLFLHRDTASFLLRETKDFTGALRVLRQINSNGSSLRGTRIKGARPWKEIKFNTGEGRKIGRMYYAKSENPKYKYYVSVSHKDLQNLDIKRLKNRLAN